MEKKLVLSFGVKDLQKGKVHTFVRKDKSEKIIHLLERDGLNCWFTKKNTFQVNQMTKEFRKTWVSFHALP
jgi:hypothetical protein